MITPSFSLTSTERVLPKLALDFTTASLDNRVTFTRTTDATHPATYVNSSGVVTAATNNQPRFDYSPTALTCKGLLIEESRTNVALKSEDFSDIVVWNPLNSTSTTGATISPDGLTNGNKLQNTASSTGFVDQYVTVGAGSYSASVYAKAGTSTRVQLYFVDTGIVGASIFELSNGTVASGTGTIANAGNGWYRCTIYATLAAGLDRLRILNQNSTNGTYIYLWGAQWEAGAFPTSYIPTTTTALTRNADVATMTGTNFSDWYSSSAGTFTATYSSFAKSGSYPDLLNVSDGTNANRFQVFTDASNGYTPTREIVSSVQQGLASYNATMGSTTKGSFAYSSAGVATAGNGGATSVGNNVTHPTGLNKLSLGCSALGNVSFLNGYLAKFAYYPQRLTSAEIQAFSK